MKQKPMKIIFSITLINSKTVQVKYFDEKTKSDKLVKRKVIYPSRFGNGYINWFGKKINVDAGVEYAHWWDRDKK